MSEVYEKAVKMAETCKNSEHLQGFIRWMALAKDKMTITERGVIFLKMYDLEEKFNFRSGSSN